MISNAEAFAELMREAMTESTEAGIKDTTASASALLSFTADEIEQMGEPFKSEFERGEVAGVTKTINGEEMCYKIRYRRNGHNISVTAKNLKTAKALFIKETQKLNKT